MHKRGFDGDSQSNAAYEEGLCGHSLPAQHEEPCKKCDEVSTESAVNTHAMVGQTGSYEAV